MPTRRLLRDFEAGRQLDLMLVAAVAAVLGIRFYLAVTGYPQVGGDTLHIAHMLWGGLLMLAALVLLLSFVGRGPHRLAALLGGLGFGTFIDEVGKFVTQDHDYFYRPTVAIIYVVFVLLYLAIRSIHRERAATPAEYLVNAVQELEQLAIDDLDRTEHDRALGYLDRYGADRPPAPALRAVFAEATLVDVGRPGWSTRAVTRWRDRYRRLSTSVWFGRALIAFFVAQFLTRLVRVVGSFVPLPAIGEQLLSVPLLTPGPAMGATMGSMATLLLISNLVAGVLVALGVIAVVRGRLLAALRRFQRSVLVTLLVTQVLVFYRVEWFGLLEFGFHLLVFFALRFMIEREAAESRA
ncbi:hypothetical protein GF314_00080 [bacterium]|nr:hypothetical protein [bacterium]